MPCVCGRRGCSECGPSHPANIAREKFEEAWLRQVLERARDSGAGKDTLERITKDFWKERWKEGEGRDR